ncbi:Na+/H+ antiporter NhaC family protein [Intestinimonas massiliensis (ex Afouda et al. 2020)]|uniref:Na+/H+ antiporter NhaC family protein n=1 Tax=Intestinimonas massiliensis (ex Afouda et al. 2020) TaxID=1673721 RepID=UPI0013EEF856|nr:Na+/H+ antiporter NhaC family protein [Intestinimonas massiliensis (ex Afouda et al. 2020)]
MSETSANTKKIPILVAVSPFIVVFAFCLVGYAIFRINIPSLFLLATAVTILITMAVSKKTWPEMLRAMGKRVGNSLGALLIIITLGAVIGAFVYSGTIPMLIYYGAQIINPSYFYVTALLTCMLVAMFCGSSWTTLGTVGIAIFAIAQAIGMNLPITMGAIWCGANFGDNCSPVSDGPNLAAAASGVDLYAAVKNTIVYAYAPAYLIVAILFFIMGLNSGVSQAAENETLQIMLGELDQIFNFNILLVLPFVMLLVGMIMKIPAAPTLVISAVLAIVLGTIFQPFGLSSGLISMTSGFSTSMVNTAGVDVAQLGSQTTSLLNRGGMNGTTQLLLVIIMAQMIIACMEESGFMARLMEVFFSKLKKERSVILATILTGICLSPCGGNAYAPQIITGSIFQRVYLEHKIDRLVLARVLLAVPGPMCSFWPWLLTPVFYHTTFGMSTLDFAIYMFPIPLTILACVITALTGFGLQRLTDEQAAEQLAAFDMES